MNHSIFKTIAEMLYREEPSPLPAMWLMTAIGCTVIMIINRRDKTIELIIMETEDSRAMTISSYLTEPEDR